MLKTNEVIEQRFYQIRSISPSDGSLVRWSSQINHVKELQAAYPTWKELRADIVIVVKASCQTGCALVKGLTHDIEYQIRPWHLREIPPLELLGMMSNDR